MKNFNQLKEKNIRIHNESDVHYEMKQWIAEQYLKKGVSLDKIYFETKLRGFGTYDYTIPDVYINKDSGTTVYCQTQNTYSWLWNFIEKTLPIAKNYSRNQIIVFPENIEVMYPYQHKGFLDLLKRYDVGVLFAPVKLSKKKKMFAIHLSYCSMNKLNKLKEKYTPEKTLIEFIENDLESLIKK